MWPVLARWRRQTVGGSITWHLAGLRADRRFWGYVHFRTQPQQDNRTFEGTLNEETFGRISGLIQELAAYANNDVEVRPFDGIIGIGTRSSFRRIFGIRNEVAEPDHPSAVRAYWELIDSLQPTLAENIIY